jgi:hypothetical protein
VEPAVVAPAAEPLVVTLAPQEPEPEPLPEPAPLPAAPPPDLGPPPPPPPLPPPPEKIFEAIWSGEPIATTTRAAPREAPRELVVASATVTHVEVAEPPPPEPTGPTIFKSGVIDGMAYTLYTDGSIEAELAHGTVKFASIDELRAYLAAREA